MKKEKSYFDKKMEDPKFREGFEKEYLKLSIGEQIIRLRKSLGWTQAQLAKACGTTASAISRYENAEYDRYELQTLYKIAHACGTKLEINLPPKAA